MEVSRSIKAVFVVVCLSAHNAISASPIAPLDLMITEVMVNPAAVSDTTGEWFELYNNSDRSLDLNGLTLSDSGGDEHIIDNSGPLIITAGDYMVLGRNGDVGLNGGYEPDYVFGGFKLSNSGDEIILSDSDIEIVRLEYSADFDIAGTSMELVGDVSIPLTDAMFTPAITSFGAGDFGTPGMPGSSIWQVKTVPIPAAFWLLGSGILGFLGLAKRKGS